MRDYFRPREFFTEDSTIEEIRATLAKLPKKGDKNFNKDCGLPCAGMWPTEHGFMLGSTIGLDTTDEAEGIYNYFHCRFYRTTGMKFVGEK